MVSAIATTLGVESQRADSIMLAVDEACANVVAHAYREDQPDAIMHVRAHTQADEIVFIISDNGSPITTNKDPSNGLGLRLIDALSDQLEIEGPGKDGTRLTIHFHLPN